MPGSFNPLTPVPPITSLGLSSTSNVITFDQNWQSSILKLFCRRKKSFQWFPDQSDRLNGAWNMHTKRSEICNEWKAQSKISCHLTHGYFIAKIAFLDDAFSEVFEWERSALEGQSLQQKVKKRRRKGRKKKNNNNNNNQKPKDIGHFLVQGMLSCCNCLFE